MTITNESSSIRRPYLRTSRHASLLGGCPSSKNHQGQSGDDPGKIVSIAPAQTEFSFDRATIQVDEILKDESEKALKVGDQIILAMPSANPATATSIDLRYPLGADGFWILEFKKGFYEATYPKDFQKLDSRSWVIKALEESKK